MATDADSHHRQNNNNTKDNDVDKEIDSNPIYDQLFNLGVKLTSNKLGQYVVRKLDRMLWTIENTAKWSVSQNISESENAVPPPSLIRPLNWFLFIPALIVMRLFRAAATFVLLLFGYDSLAPITIVKAVQKQRRILRAVRYQGLKTIRARNAVNAQHVKKGIFSALLSMVSGLICLRPNLEEPAKVVVKSNNQSEGHASKKRLLSDDECSKEDDIDLNLTCADLLDKYGSISSCGDSDFDPEAIEEDTSSESDEESEPEGRTDKNDMEEENHETEDEAATEPEKIEEPNKANISEPVEIIQTNNYRNEYNKESHSATLFGSNPDDKFYSPIESPVPSEEHNHSVIHDNGDSHSHQSKLPAKFFHNQPHNFNHKQSPPQAANRFNFHYQHNSHEPSRPNHTSSFDSAGFLVHEKLAHHTNGGSNNTQYHEPKMHHVPPPPPSSLSPTSSTSSSTTNVTSTEAGSNSAAGNNNQRKKNQTKYNRNQKNRYYGGGNKQNTKKNTY